MLAAFSALVPVILLIVAGFWLRRTILPEEMQWNGIERLTYYVLFPALIIDTLARADLASVPILGVGAALFLAILIMAALCLALRPWLAARFAIGGPAFTSVMQGATRWNTFVALVLAASLFGPLGVALASVAIVAMIPVLNVINVWSLARFASEHPQHRTRDLRRIDGKSADLVVRGGIAAQSAGRAAPRTASIFSRTRSGAHRSPAAC